MAAIARCDICNELRIAMGGDVVNAPGAPLDPANRLIICSRCRGALQRAAKGPRRKAVRAALQEVALKHMGSPEGAAVFVNVLLEEDGREG